MVEGEEHLSFAHVLTFIYMNLGDESCNLRADVNVGFALDCCGISVFKNRIACFESHCGDSGRLTLWHLLLSSAAGENCEGCSGDKYAGGFQ